MKHIFTLFCFLLTAKLGFSQPPTWEKQVSCIIYSHCTSCHNPNGLAPFSLTSYKAAYLYRSSILNAVVTKKMPPYLPYPTYGHLANAKVLTDEEKNIISAWVAAGAPSGDTTQALPPPTYTQTQVITAPDLTGKIPNYTIPNVGEDLYQAFIITNPNPTVKYITQIEVVPGNRNVVHHVLVYQDSTNTPVLNDSAYPGPGYVSFGGIGSQTAKLLATWVPGSSVYTLPAGMGIKLSAGSRLVVQIHYPDGSGGQMDSTKINVKFSPTALRDVTIAPVLNPFNMTNGPLFIPANTTKTFNAQYTVPINVTIISVGPHAHLLCKKFEVYGKTLLGDTIKIIKIDDWDFHWQGSHSFQKPIKIPAGTKLYSSAFYDNTVNNHHNPNNPPQDVSQGEATTDEMMLIYFSYLPYAAGDENIIYDTASHNPHYLNCVPEPVGLPVTLLYFDAAIKDRIVQLKWATAQEQNSSHFEIERSSDGINFKTIERLNAAHNSDRQINYSYKDFSPLSNLNYYRIKMVDKNGKFTYSTIRVVNVEMHGTITVFPNPAKSGAEIKVTSHDINVKRMEVVNAIGQVVYGRNMNTNGSTSFPIKATLPAGQYVIRIIKEGAIETTKLVIQ